MDAYARRIVVAAIRMIRLTLSSLELAAFAACALLSAPARAQQASADSSCEGRRISRITIDANKPPFSGSARKWQLTARALGLHHAVTRDDVVRTYLLFKQGGVCSIERIRESERVLRALPFLADATARVSPDSDGQVSVDIKTTDEVPVLVSGSLRHGVPSALSLGNEDVAGLGLRLVVGGETGGAYRSGGRVEVEDLAPFDAPIDARALVERDQLGSQLQADVAHRFLSNVQRGAWDASFRRGDDFIRLVRPAGDDEAVEVRSDAWSASAVVRSTIRSTVWLTGPVVLGTRETPVPSVILVTPQGPADTEDSAILRRFSSFQSVRAGALIGVRRVRYVTRTGVDALFAPQDVMTGWQLGALAAPGLVSGGGHDVLVASSAALGSVFGSMVNLGDVEAEARRDGSSGGWQSVVADARGATYFTLSPRLVADVQDEFSSIAHSLVPRQLLLGDPLGGPRGYLGSKIAGARRNVARAELRWASPNAAHRADIGVALFADAATILAGDAAYGASASRESIGISLLGAYPTRSKRVYRIDLAMPLERAGGARFEIRFTSADPATQRSMEPADVARARLAPIPSSLFAWPAP